ncbi:MAG: zinc ABC transporter substrate-binding protein [Dehalococcoidia bacterium]
MKANRCRLASKVVWLALAAVLAGFGVSCGQDEEVNDRIGVIVTISPQAEFVERVGGEKVDVTVIIPPGANPHTYELTPSQMRDVAGAEIYAKVGSGVEFELSWMDRIEAQNKAMLVVDCAEGVELTQLTGAQRDEAEDARHRTLDPHIWMSPPNAEIMVKNIYDGLVQVDPDNRAYYEENLDAYLQELSELDQDIRDGLSQVANRVFMVYHPRFGYFAEEYGLAMLAIEEGGKEPTAAGIAHLVVEAQENDIKVVFASPQFNPQSARVIADEIGGRVVFVDTLAGDYVANLRVFLGELIQAME